MKCPVCFLFLAYFVHYAHCIYNPEDLTVKPLTVKKATWRKIALKPEQIVMHHNYSRVQHITPQKTTYQPPSRQPKIDPRWQNPDQKVEERNKSEPIENTDENLETAPEQKIQKVTLEQRISSQYGGIEQLDYTKSRITNRNKLDEEVDVQIHDKLAPMEDKFQVQDKLGELFTSSSDIRETKQNYTPSTGVSNLPPLEKEIDVFGFHYPPRDYEVYPFKKQPKPYSNMAFEKCPKMVTGQLVFYWSCSQYLNCYKGRGYISNCAPGTLFNPESLECDFPEKVVCISGPRNQKVKSEKLVAETNEGIICQPNFSGLSVHPGDCTKFLNCVNGQTYVQTCGPGTVFNPKISACDHAYNSDCEIEVNTGLPYIDENAGSSNLPTRNNFGRQYPNPTLPTLKEVQRNYSTSFGSNQGSKLTTGTSNYDLITGQTQHLGSYQASSNPSRQFHMYSSQMGAPNYGQSHSQTSQFPSSSNNFGQNPSNSQYAGAQNSGCKQGSVCNTQSSGQGTSSHTQNGQNVGCQQGSGCNTQTSNQEVSNYHRIVGQSHVQLNQDTGIRPGCAQTHESLIGASSTYSRGPGSTNIHTSRSVEDGGSVKCPPGQTGLVPHPFICEKFLNCANGRTFVQDCGPGTVFNQKIQACDWPYNVNCKTQGGNQQYSNYQNRNVQTGREIEFTTDQRGSASQQHSISSNVGQVECKDGFHKHGQGVISNQNGFRGVIGQRRDYGHQGYVPAPIPTWIPAHSIPRPTVVIPSPSVPTYVYTTYPGVPYTPSRGQYVPQFIPQRPPPIHTTPKVTYSMSSSSSASHGQSRPQYFPTPKPHTTYSMTSSVSSSGGYVPVFTNGHSAGTGQQKVPFDLGTGQQNVHLNVGTGQRVPIGFNPTDQKTPIYDGQHRVTVDFGAGHAGVPIVYGTGQPEKPMDFGTGQEKVPSDISPQKVPVEGGTSQQKVPFDASYDEPDPTNVSYEDFEGLGRVPVDLPQETTTLRDYRPVYIHATPNLGPTVYVRPQQTLQPPHPPPQNRTFYIRPTIPNIQTNQGGQETDQIPSFSQTHPSYSPHVPVYFQPEQKPNDTTWFSTTERTSVYVQKIPRRGMNASIPNWPPPFPSTDISADYHFEEEATTIKPVMKVWKTSNFCGGDQFECGVRDCIPLHWVCNGHQDCPNDEDEKNCAIYLQHFTLIPNSRLFKHELEKWLNTDLHTCSNYCLNAKNFKCKSFNFRREDKVCLLCDTNVGLSGALAPSPQYDYYELKDLTVDCTSRYECSNKRCINYSQVCDGADDCGNRQDEKNCDAATLGYEVRLAGSRNLNEGRIEIKVFEEWGYICDDQFGLRDAHVACKELGFPLGALEVKTSSWFAPYVRDNETYYLMDDVSCLGNETSLRDCDFNGWGVHNCMPQEIVGVVCKTPQESCPENEWQCDTGKECLSIEYVCDGVFDCEDQSDEAPQHCDAPIEVRLANGSSKMEGRVEVKYHGLWGTICDDDFNDMAARVICRSLGFYGSALAKKDGAFGPGSGPIWLDQVNCLGNESFIQDCLHWHWGEHNCDHAEDAAVICSKSEDSILEKRSRDRNTMNLDVANTIPPGDILHPIKCGHRNEDVLEEESKDYSFRVVSGSVAKKGEYPWQATIRVKGKTKSAHWCGAVVISNKFVLTAAHCLVGFSKGAYFIRAGDYDVDHQEGTEVEAYIEDFFIHEKFRQGGHMNNDIALIKLKGNGLRMSKHVQPVCLPEKDAVYKEGMNCTISGFGSTQTGKSTSSHILRAGWVPMQRQEICKLDTVYGKAITDGMICAGSLDEGVDSCDGDSGGPLACLHKGLFTLYGLTSWGQHCGHANKPGVYVKISYYRDWIDKKIEENS